MMKMLQQDWGMTNSLAEKFYKYLPKVFVELLGQGGDIYTSKQALDSLIRKEDKFDPYVVMTVPGLPSLCKDPEARAHLENIAGQGFSPVEDVKTDRGTRMIAKENVGGAINKEATTFGLPEIFIDTDRKWAVIPSTYHMCMMIVESHENTPLPSTGKSESEPVWVRQLREDGAGGFELVGNAFQIDPAPTNVGYLEKAIGREEKLTIPASRIDIYLQQDGAWSKQDEEAPVERGASKSDCYGFLLP